MSEEDIGKIAIITPFGLFEYLFMPFGLRNSTTTFQCFMDNIFMDINSIFVYIDDILVSSETQTQHYEDLQAVLSILAENNRQISLDKCEFFKDNINFLGYNISFKGLIPTKQKLHQIQESPEPKVLVQISWIS